MPRPKNTDRKLREEVARRVQQARLGKGLTREQLAEAIDVAPETLWRYESGRLPLSLTMLYKVADALGVPAEMLIKREAPSSAETELLDGWRLLDAEGQRALLILVRWAKGSSRLGNDRPLELPERYPEGSH